MSLIGRDANRWAWITAAALPALLGTGALAQGGKIGGEGQTVKTGQTASGTTSVKYREAGPYSEADIERWISGHGERTQTTRYVYLQPSVTDLRLRNVMRVGIFKALNHICLGARELVIGQDVSEGRGLVFAFDSSRCFVAPYQRTDHWDDIAKAVEKQLETRNSPAAAGYLTPFARPDRAPAHQFVYNATHGGVYNQVMEWEGFEQALNESKKISPTISLKTYITNAIVCGPRLITGHKLGFYGEEKWFFRSHDEFIGRAGGRIADGYLNQAPTEQNYRRQGSFVLQATPGDNDTAVASEWWFEMPNGFLAWGIHGEGGQERSGAESGFAIDPFNPGLNLETGRCITCHTQGPKRAYDPEAISGRGGWTPKAQLDEVFNAIYDRQKQAMIKLVTSLSDADKQTNDDMIEGTIEPVLYTLRLYEDEQRGAGREFGRRVNAVNLDARDSIGSCENFCSGQSLANSFCKSAPEAGRFK